jgi:hypothetical protein
MCISIYCRDQAHNAMRQEMSSSTHFSIQATEGTSSSTSPPLSELVSKLVMSYRTCVIHCSIGLQFLAFLCLPVLEDPQPRRQLKQAGYEIKLSSLVARRTPSQVATPGPIWGHVSSLVPLNLWVTWLPHRA